MLCYTNQDEVELFLNGRSLGRKKRSDGMEIPANPNIVPGGKFITRYRIRWDVPYEPGVLTAKSGELKEEVRTAGAPARVRITPDREAIMADGNDLAFFTVRIEDKDGVLCPMADSLVRFKVTGPGKIAAVDNGNAATIEPFQADYRKAFSGMCLVVLRSLAGKVGPVEVAASSDGLTAGVAKVRTRV